MASSFHVSTTIVEDAALYQNRLQSLQIFMKKGKIQSVQE